MKRKKELIVILSSLLVIVLSVVHPTISLKACTLWSQGDGSASNPYEIALNGGC